MSGLEIQFWKGAGLFAAVAATAAAFPAVATPAVTPTTTTTAAAIATTAAATTPAAATAAVTTAITAAATTTTEARALLARTGNVHRQGAALEFVTVEFLDGLLGLVAAAHRDEGKAARTTGELVEDDFNDADSANLAKQGFEVLGGAGEG